jgi:hypothetical protein
MSPAPDRQPGAVMIDAPAADRVGLMRMISPRKEPTRLFWGTPDQAEPRAHLALSQVLLRPMPEQSLSLDPPIIVDESLSWARVGPARPIGGASTGWSLWKPPMNQNPTHP